MLNELSEEYKKKLKIIKNHFGENAQYKKFIEELKELREAMYRIQELKYRNPNPDDFEKFLILQWDTYNSGVLSEIADCYVVAYQINETDFLRSYIEDLELIPPHLIYQNTRNARTKIIEIMKFKIDRTIERIRTGYYDE
ncbi:MAG: hypothetical protein LBV03_04560 [Fusobacteriales bacterium]|jgi:hypothetical protein|nr:hypothetical protein [Fusobacteriales bacterium]